MSTCLSLNSKNILVFSNLKINCLLTLFKYLLPPNGVCTEARVSKVGMYRGGEGLCGTLPHTINLDFLTCFLFQPTQSLL